MMGSPGPGTGVPLKRVGYQSESLNFKGTNLGVAGSRF